MVNRNPLISVVTFISIAITHGASAIALTAKEDIPGARNASPVTKNKTAQNPDGQKARPKPVDSRKSWQINPTGEPPLSAQQSEKLIQELRGKKIGLPISGFDVCKIKGSFYETHGGVQHGASDFLAARNTPVLAVDNGTIAKLFLSKAGGITIYQSDPSRKFIYYYAHLEKYADHLHEGQSVKKGETIGFVGTSGNAPKNTPHLHFSVGMQASPEKWWVNSSVDPYEVYK